MKLAKIVSLGSMKTHKLLERASGPGGNLNESLLLYGGDQGILYIINASSHEVIDYWKIGEPISSIDCTQNKEDIYIAVATYSNNIYINVNFIEANEKIEVEKQIKCIKFISDINNHIILGIGMEGGYLYFVNVDQQNNAKKHNQNTNNNTSNLNPIKANGTKALAGNPMASHVNVAHKNMHSVADQIK